MLSTIIALVVVYLVFILITLIRKHNYWKNKNVVGPRPIPFIGNFGKVLIRKESITKFCVNIYRQFPNEKAIGLYQGYSATLILRDPELIKDVLIKDFAHFSDRGTKISNDPLSENLFNAEIDPWRKMRHGFTPMFSSGKLKSMSPLIHTCVEEFQEYVDKLVEENVEHEIRALMAKYTLEVIGSCAFGLKLGNLTQDENLFREIADIIFKPSTKSNIWRGLNVIFPGIIKFFNISLSNPRVLQFFRDLVQRVVSERDGKSMVRKDFMDHLIELREKMNNNIVDTDKSLKFHITNDVMAAQALVFYAAGFETSSASMSFLIHELALNQEFQDKIFKEVNSVIQKHGALTYDAVCDMSYLEMAFDEILRKHPPGGALIRNCVIDYKFSKINLKIEPGVKVLIPVMALHHDPQYFENPDEFNPDRFSVENKRNIKPCTYIPFGEGPRNCIGNYSNMFLLLLCFVIYMICFCCYCVFLHHM